MINCFEGDLSSLHKWWRSWLDFMFDSNVALVGSAAASHPATMLQKIKRAKYPKVTPEEEAISIPLQTLAQVSAHIILDFGSIGVDLT